MARRRFPAWRGKIGQIKPGYSADLILLKPTLRLRPLRDIVHQLVFCEGGHRSIRFWLRARSSSMVADSLVLTRTVSSGEWNRSAENAPALQSHQRSSRPFSENHSRTLQKGSRRKGVAGEITILESEKCYADVKANADCSLSLHWPEPS